MTKKSSRLKNPKDHAGILSKFTFFYFFSIVKHCYKTSFTEEDIYEPLSDFRSQKLGDQFENIWNRSLLKWKNTKSIFLITTVLFKQFYRQFLPAYIFFCIVKLPLSYYQPILLGKIVGQFKIPNNQSWDIYYFGIALIVANLAILYSMQHFIQIVCETSIKFSMALSTMIYRKTLKLQPSDFQKSTQDHLGNKITLITKDVFNFLMPIAIISEGILMLVIVLVQIINVVVRIGEIGTVVFAIFVLEIVIEIALGFVARNKRLKACFYSAQRIVCLKEAFSMIRSIKFNTWEKFFEKRIDDHRRKEIKYLRSIFNVRIGSFVIGNLSSSTAFVITTILYIWINGTISAELLYFLMSSVDTMKYFFSVLVPNGVSRTGELVASLRRIQNFLLLEESCALNNNDVPNPIIEVRDLNIIIDDNILKENINFKVPSKGLIVITGSLSSGKTVFLKTILREFDPKGLLKVEGSLSYASQEPWLFPGTIKQNILFNQRLDLKRYEEIIDSCALVQDFNSFNNGDNTLIIDDGLNLSAGQQKRINLARAIYPERQIYLLDSVFCNIDIKTSRFIFQKVIKEVLKDKIVILVSNDLYHIKNADVVINFGQKPLEPINKLLLENQIVDNSNCRKTELSLSGLEEDLFDESSKLINNIEDSNEDDIYKEKSSQGSMPIKIFTTYVNYCGGFWIALGVVILFIASQFFINSSQKAISIWINKEGYLSRTNQSQTDLYLETIHSRNRWFITFIATYSLSILFIILATYTLFLSAFKASQKIHKSMTTSSINTKMQFFCSTLLGVILNRFSKDVNNLDEELPFNLYLAITVVLEILGICILIISTQWILVVPILLIILLAFMLMRFIFFSVVTKVKRMESALHSPLVGHLTSSVKGLSTIRVLAANNQQQMISQFDQHQDLFASASYIILCTVQLLKYSVHLLGDLFVIALLVYFMNSKSVTPGDVGLGIGKSLAMLRYIRRFLTCVMEMEADMTSMERVSEYLNLKPEARSGFQMSKNWPEKGAIAFKNVNLRYSPLQELILKNINIEIKPLEKVAVIGRTGSGKSSLISCLFRLFDYSGSIIIDGVDIKGLDLNYLRSRFGIVSQDSSVFVGSLRQNLDPFNQHSNEEILSVLQKIRNAYLDNDTFNLQNVLLDENLNKKLENLTPGEMQLIALMRVLLSKKRIIILDEVTSNLDENTNEIIDKIVKDFFQDQTVITVAHRLNKIETFDKVCVLAAGEVVEFGQPEDLLKNPNSKLSKILNNKSSFPS